MKSKDLILRFVLGGLAVMLSYLVSVVLPWKLLAGMFAAFPAVMVTAVMVVGQENGSRKAAQIAQGAFYGMLGCAVCVLTVLVFLNWRPYWWLSILFGIVLWFGSAVVIARMKDWVTQQHKHKAAAAPAAARAAGDL
ncbi:hypothetical protein DNH61_05050 [Paenibacillus sambharensis]|uniref:DUF3147 domain-containing protein n=1 Tax=Paenibacillus sambharensis TaxID=1803190 RepID=A0A2W1LCN1_9BACL|nr:DUF3147 family protein [Paenibacillus sambharensis]PZD96886.1 hypothetical protein DNH61_05050 [Paenibacillus sambharensis]